MAETTAASTAFPVQRFPALDETGVCVSAFIRRIPGIDVSHDKEEALGHLESTHRRIRTELGVGDWPLLTAQQVHGNDLVVVNEVPKRDTQFPGADGMVTNQREVLLGIHVADCGAVYIVDPVARAIGLVHSGKKGTELNIAGRAIVQLTEKFGAEPSRMVVQLSPCIRPPHYEVDFAATIIQQCREAGVRQIHDGGECTGCDLERFYSYRLEKGKTGRMLALLGLK